MILIVLSWVVALVAANTARVVVIRERALQRHSRRGGVRMEHHSGSRQICVGVITLALVAVGAAATLSVQHAQVISTSEQQEIVRHAAAGFNEDDADVAELSRGDISRAVEAEGGDDSVRVLPVLVQSDDTLDSVRALFQVMIGDGTGPVCVLVDYYLDDNREVELRATSAAVGLC